VNEFPKEWYWVVCLILFFMERDAMMDLCFALITLITKIGE